MRAHRWALSVMTALVLSCDKPAAPENVRVSRIDIEPPNVTVSSGSVMTLVARAFDAAGDDLGPQRVFWSSENSLVASVSQGGVVTGVAPGHAQIAASVNGISGVATVSVTAPVVVIPVATVRVTPATASVPQGDFVQLTATPLDLAGNPLSGRVVMWSSNNQTVAIVSSTGQVHGVSQGVATITATSEGKSGTAQVTIAAPPPPAAVASVVLDVSPDSVWVGNTVSGTVTLRDASSNVLPGRSVTLTSSSTAVGTVTPATGTTDVTGRLALTVTGVSGGTAKITASSGGKNDTFDVRVLAPVATVSVTPTLRSVQRGKTTTLTVVARSSNGTALAGRVCAITSNNTSVATVTPTSGMTAGNGEIRLTVTGVALGTATITATCEGKSGASIITVTL